jgi:hypothetical protein
MKVYIDPKYVEPENRFGKSFPLEAELTEELIDECGLREGLEKFGRKLAEQMQSGEFRDSKAVVIGVEIREISFSMLLEHPAPKHRYADLKVNSYGKN